MSQKSRKLSRRLLFQKLFLLSFNNISDEEFFNSFYYDDGKIEIDRDYFLEMQKIIIDKEDFFINLIEKYAPKFKIQNMSVLSIFPVYIALAEIFFFSGEIPALVSINEAIEISKVFSDVGTKKIVNGILNNIYKDYNEINKNLENYNKKQNFSFFKLK